MVRRLVRLFGRLLVAALLWVPQTQAAQAGDPSRWLIAAVANHPPQLRQLCDFAVAAAQLQALPLADDPVFRPPTPQRKAELGRIRKSIMGGANAEPELRALFAGPEGPTLARMALQDHDPRMQLAAVRAAVGLAKAHPRLFGFMPTLDAKTPAALADALVAFDFATQCDTPVLFAQDGLGHPDAGVVKHIVAETVAVSAQTGHPAALNRMVDWMLAPAAPPKLRADAIRALAGAGYVHLVPALQRLRHEPNRMIAHEALIALAVVAPLEVAALVPTMLASPLPDVAATGLRMARMTHASEPGKIVGAVTSLQRSNAVWKDELSAERVPIGGLATAVLAAWAM